MITAVIVVCRSNCLLQKKDAHPNERVRVLFLPGFEISRLKRDRLFWRTTT